MPMYCCANGQGLAEESAKHQRQTSHKHRAAQEATQERAAGLVSHI